MNQRLTQDLTDFVAGLNFSAIPGEAVSVAKAGFMDCIGVLLAGCREPVSQAVKDAITLDAPRGTSSVFLQAPRLNAPSAAWINGTSAHALDYDDVALKGSHPSAVLVPAILAEAEALDASGEAMIAAYLAGYEVWADLVYRDRGNYQRKGWHPTGIFGALAAAASCAVLRKLDARAAANALGIAASYSSGIMANLGFMAKPTHAGRAATSGIIAARFASAGIDAATDALEHDQGLLRALSPAGDIDFGPATAGKAWKALSEGLSVKKFPVCYRAHRAIDAMMDLLQAQPVGPDAIERITVSMSKTHSMILKNHRPVGAIEAKFSIEFAMACAVVAGQVGLRQLTDEFVRDPAVQRLIERVTIEVDEVEEPGTSGYAVHDSVRVRLVTGEELASKPVRIARGDPRLPLTQEDMWKKFEDCIAWSGLPIDAKRLFDRILNLEKLKSSRTLSRTASGGRRSAARVDSASGSRERATVSL